MFIRDSSFKTILSMIFDDIPETFIHEKITSAFILFTPYPL